MYNSFRDERATMLPVPVADEIERLIVRFLFDVDPDVYFVPKVSRIRQRLQEA